MKSRSDRRSSFKVARVLVAVVLVGLLPARLSAQRPEKTLPDPKAGYSWQDAARKEGLDGADIEQLSKQKVLVSHEAFKQVFTPYLSSPVPLFITSDSVLNAYHVLFEESILRLEKANARRLPDVLRTIWHGLPEAEKGIKVKPETLAAAMTRAKVAIGTAMRLVGIDDIKPEPKIAAWIDEEVKRVMAGSGQHKAAWLGPPDPGFLALDYTRYKPRGFYTKSEALSRYFRAVAWLQSIPFRISKDEELLAILMLGKSIHSNQPRDYEREHQTWLFFAAFRRVLGGGDDLDLEYARMVTQLSLLESVDEDPLERARELIKDDGSQQGAQGRTPQVNDQLALPANDPTKTAEPTFRILVASRTPDATLFGRTTDIRRFPQQRMPTGLEVATALGSELARSRLAADPQGKALLAEIDRAKPLFTGRSLYVQYLDCLRALADKPEPDAPRFMASEAWQIKSCQTVLGGWAQLRHTWALQAKQNVEYLCVIPSPTGLVEPTPEFYARLARLAEDTHELLKEANALSIDPREVAADIRRGIPIMRQFAAASEAAARRGDKTEPKLPPVEDITVAEKAMLLSFAMAPGRMPSSPSEREEAFARVEKLAEQLEKEGIPASGKVADAIRRLEIDMDSLWRELARLCRRLEALAHKQLRGVAFSEQENELVGSFGTRLAKTMLYGGNSYVTPKDDAPRAIDVYTNPNAGTYLEVAIGRPRAIYVLYPYQGAEILCRGAVMPYFEFVHHSRLTDAEWITLLDLPKIAGLLAPRPPLPPWATPIYSTRGQGRPELKAGH